MPDSRREAEALMRRFAERTGLDSERPPRRYLWTDAFAVCNWLGLAERTGKVDHTALALRLVERVHETLGRHREDDPREGWISGLGEAEGRAHPTRGGLRIGKPLPERRADEPFDERLEWERDGQYFHYLTKWVHALDQCTRATGAFRFNGWGRELAETAYEAFSYTTTGARRRRMYWKMSIDLSRPLVPAMGQHDPLDGFVTASQLASTAAKMPDPPVGPSVDEEISGFATMIDPTSFATTDPLGLGGLLTDAARLAQLDQEPRAHRELAGELLASARDGLEAYRASELRRPAESRLAFRELGLAIGLHAVSLMTRMEGTPSKDLEPLLAYVPLADEIETFWRDPAHRGSSTWAEHQDINDVMLATSLAPEGFLLLGEI